MSGTEKPAAAAELVKKSTGHTIYTYIHTYIQELQSDSISQEQKQMLQQPFHREMVTNQCNP